MRNIFCLALAVGSITASPLGPAYENQKDVNADVDRGVVRHFPHGYPGHPTGGCSEGSGYPPWYSSSTSLTSTTRSITPTSSPTSSQVSSTSSSAAPTPSSPSSSSAVTSTSTIVNTTTVTRTSTFTTSSAPLTSAPTTSNSQTSSGASTVTTCSVTASPPAPTQPGVVDGCSKWYVAEAGDFCYKIAEKFSITLNTFFAWNPAVLPPDCKQLLAGDAYCVQVCGDTALTSVSTSYTPLPTPTNSAPLPSLTQGPHDIYQAYCGDGSVAQGWPSISQWLEFDYLFEQNRPNMRISCANWGVPYDSNQEIDDIKKAISQVAGFTEIDARFILAIVMQESTGCVRVITTEYSHLNPGLMQSWKGIGTCNRNQAYLGIAGTSSTNVTTPCPYQEIYQMIKDGTNGTAADNSGLRQNYAWQNSTGAQGYYRTAKIYNGGNQTLLDNENSLESGCCTGSYVSDIANRLTGWINAARDFTC